jgi:hypothetical protein
MSREIPEYKQRELKCVGLGGHIAVGTGPRGGCVRCGIGLPNAHGVRLVATLAEAKALMAQEQA